MPGSKVIKYIQENDLRFNFNKERLDLIEFYLRQNTAVLRDHYFDALLARISYKIKPKNEAYIIQRGLAYLSEHLYLLQNFFQDLEPTTLPDFLHLFLQDLKLIYAIPKLNSFVNPIDKKMSLSSSLALSKASSV